MRHLTKRRRHEKGLRVATHYGHKGRLFAILPAPRGGDDLPARFASRPLIHRCGYRNVRLYHSCSVIELQVSGPETWRRGERKMARVQTGLLSIN